MKPAVSTNSIKITVDSSGHFTYSSEGSDAKRKRVKHGQKVNWMCDDGNFAILFNEGSPFREIGYVGPKGGTTPDAHLDHGNPGETFKYSVMLVRDGKDLTDDPDIIIDDGSPSPPRHRGTGTKKAGSYPPKAVKKSVKKQASAKKRR